MHEYAGLALARRTYSCTPSEEVTLGNVPAWAVGWALATLTVSSRSSEKNERRRAKRVEEDVFMLQN